MTEQQTNLLLFYKGWDDYQALLAKANRAGRVPEHEGP